MFFLNKEEPCCINKRINTKK